MTFVEEGGKRLAIYSQFERSLQHPKGHILRPRMTTNT